jgi:hypothetical protein
MPLAPARPGGQNAGMDGDNLSVRQRIWRALLVATCIGLAATLPVCFVVAAVVGLLFAFIDTMDRMD